MSSSFFRLGKFSAVISSDKLCYFLSFFFWQSHNSYIGALCGIYKSLRLPSLIIIFLCSSDSVISYELPSLPPKLRAAMWSLDVVIAFLNVASSDGISQEYPKILSGTSGLLLGGYTCFPHSQPWQTALLV